MEKLTRGVWAFRVEPPIVPDPPAPPKPDEDDDAVLKARYEADQQRAEALKLKKQLEELQRTMPSDEQRAKWAEMEAAQQKAEEDRLKKSGEFDQWRVSINAKHGEELAAERALTANEKARAEAIERELNDTLISQSFYGATDWFGPTGKTVLLPDFAKSYFERHITVDVVPHPNGGIASRRVLVKDYNGTVIVDPKSGKPASFDYAIGELISSHPQKNQLLRGSGKVGSGSTGGNNADGGIDIGRLKPGDFHDSAVRDKVRDHLRSSGGLRSPAFEAAERARRGNKS